MGVIGQMPHVLSRASCMESSLGLCPPAPRKKDGLILEQEVVRGWGSRQGGALRLPLPGPLRHPQDKVLGAPHPQRCLSLNVGVGCSVERTLLAGEVPHGVESWGWIDKESQGKPLS